jgi:hypothetical protein
MHGDRSVQPFVERGQPFGTTDICRIQSDREPCDARAIESDVNGVEPIVRAKQKPCGDEQ